tara:strand:+ start:235 stop:345 length:111 start_codon:yes stop_codon:yes gene_type:complete
MPEAAGNYSPATTSVSSLPPTTPLKKIKKQVFLRAF